MILLPLILALDPLMLTVSSCWNTPMMDEPQASEWGIRKNNHPVQSYWLVSVAGVYCASVQTQLPIFQECVSCTFSRDTTLILAHIPSTAEPLVMRCIPGTSHHGPL